MTIGGSGGEGPKNLSERLQKRKRIGAEPQCSQLHETRQGRTPRIRKRDPTKDEKKEEVSWKGEKEGCDKNSDYISTTNPLDRGGRSRN